MNRTAEHYDSYAQEYESRWKGYLENTHQKMLGALLPDLEEGDRILDLSCGTGLLARQLIEQEAPFGELVLNDISPRMLEVAREGLPDDPRITYTSFSASDLELPDNRFDRVISLNAFHNYEGQSGVIRQIERILVPDGRFYLLDWNRKGAFRLVNAMIRWTGSETVQTNNLPEIKSYLEEEEFHIVRSDEWRYRYWQLFLVVAGFQPWRKE